ncbi:MAG: 3-deoxy-7-phosphoheptulonate synthase, partial [Gemmatimonadaceae bacterium]|nr:3-deoxy-7-phosphoheptulonate synthase [Gemmatimonadaceae bacterium]
MIKSESAHLKIARPQATGGFPTNDGSRPYRLAAHAPGGGVGRSTRPVRISDTVTIGGTAIAVIAGPCSVESAEMIVSIANRVKSMGAVMLRGGAFKPRTSPYSFNGLGE